MACCQQFVQGGGFSTFIEETINSGRGCRLPLDASEGPSYPVELDDNRFTIPASSLLERPTSPSESVSEESMTIQSEESFTDDDEDWQESNGVAQLVIPMVLKIIDDQKKASQLENQEQNVRMASGGGGGQEQQPADPQEADPMEDADQKQNDAREDEEDVGDVPANPAPVQRRGGPLSEMNERLAAAEAAARLLELGDNVFASYPHRRAFGHADPFEMLRPRETNLAERPNPSNVAHDEMELEEAVRMAMGQPRREQEVDERMEEEESVEDEQEEANPKRKRQYDGGADPDQKRRRGNDDGAGSSGAAF